MKSIRIFLIVATLAMLVLVVFVSAVQGFQSSMREAERLFDSQLLEQSHFAANLRADRPLISQKNEHTGFQLWRKSPGAEPALLAHTDNIPGLRITTMEPGFGYANFSGYRWRTYVYYPDNSDVIAVAASRTDVRYRLAENIITEAILPVVIALPLSGFLIWLIIGRGLKPLKDLAGQLRQKESRDLSPIDLPHRPMELDQVVNSVNALLSRLQAAFEREKRFASDAAHELRTPISALKIQIHNLEYKYPEHSDELNQLSLGVERMQHLVEQILALYRVTPEQFSAKFVVIDLYALTQAVIAENYASFERKSQSVELTGNGSERAIAALMEGDRFALETLIANLLSNANKYTPAHGTIHVDVSRNDVEVSLMVEDNGPGIAAEDRERIFERFHRIGGDRHDSGEPGCGLGLAIVRNIVELHHGVISVGDSFTGFVSDPASGHGARFTVNFPAPRC